jgi:hypothetical protein
MENIIVANILKEIKNSNITLGNKEQLSYSILTILYEKVREKELMHSEIIASIFTQGIQLGYGEHLFKYFAEEINLEIDSFKSEVFNIETEKGISNQRRIDILLSWNGKAIIIENKLNNAEDQPNQLNDYYKGIIDQFNIQKIVYVPGSETKTANIDVLEEDLKELLVNIYPNNIIRWLKRFMSAVNNLDSTYQKTLKDYIYILKLTNMENKKIKEALELRDILGENKTNILSAHKIYERWNDIKWHTEMDFWNDFESYINGHTNYKIKDSQKFSPDNLSSAIHRSQKRFVHYGITFKISKKDGYSICLSIERGYENMYYGIILKNNKDEWCNVNNSIFKELKNKAIRLNEGVLPITDENLWVLSKYFNKAINFDAFSSEETLKLINKDHRDEVIEECWKEINDLVSSFGNLLEIKDGYK